MKNFSEIFKKGFLSDVEYLTLESFVMSMLVAFLCGVIIYLVYRNFFKGVVYNNNFNILLMMTTVITSFLVIVISSNVVLSLGMVGALSIVRFRSAVKDPLDVGFLFFSVASGITAGAGLYLISLLGTVFVSLVYILMVMIRTRQRVYLFIVKFENKAGVEIREVLKNTKKTLKNRTASGDMTELTFEMKITDDNTAFVNDVAQIDGVHNAVLVDFTGDYCE